MERALQTPELLDIIFAHTDIKTAVACATVNKNFFDSATNQIWHTVFDLQDILSILAPIAQIAADKQVDYLLL